MVYLNVGVRIPVLCLGSYNEIQPCSKFAWQLNLTNKNTLRCSDQNNCVVDCFLMVLDHGWIRVHAGCRVGSVYPTVSQICTAIEFNQQKYIALFGSKHLCGWLNV